MEKSWKLEDLYDCLVWTQDLTPRIIIIIIITTSNLNILYSKEVKENQKFRDKNKKIRI